MIKSQYDVPHGMHIRRHTRIKHTIKSYFLPF